VAPFLFVLVLLLLMLICRTGAYNCNLLFQLDTVLFKFGTGGRGLSSNDPNFPDGAVSSKESRVDKN
jgi:hypothetical protein